MPTEETSDGDGAERPVREKLKKTSIASLAQYTKATGDSNSTPQLNAFSSDTDVQNPLDEVTEETPSTARGRPARKRSFDDLQNEDVHHTMHIGQQGLSMEKNGQHKRMRSRDMSSGEGAVLNGQADTEPPECLGEEEDDVIAIQSPGGAGVLIDAPARSTTTPPPTRPAAEKSILSPKKKRSRDQFDKDHHPRDDRSEGSSERNLRAGSEVTENEDQLAQATSRTATGEPEKKRPRDEDQQTPANNGGTAQEVRPPLLPLDGKIGPEIGFG